MLFRTWSHYRALKGGKYLEALLSRDMVTPTASQEMDDIYAAGLPSTGSHPGAQPASSENVPYDRSEHGKTMLLKRWDGKLLAETFKLPELEIEVSRACDQVEAMVMGEVKAEEHAVKDKVPASAALELPTDKQ